MNSRKTRNSQLLDSCNQNRSYGNHLYASVEEFATLAKIVLDQLIATYQSF